MIARIELNKLDVVKRQLLTAVNLFFNEEELISIHTLVSASYEILRNVSKHKKTKYMFVKDRYINSMNEKDRKDFIRDLNKPQNFFKHADNDHNEILSFAPLLTEIFLLDACEQYCELTNEIIPEFHIFEMWFLTKNPEYFDISEDWKAFIDISKMYHQKNNPKGFYKEILIYIQNLKFKDKG